MSYILRKSRDLHVIIVFLNKRGEDEPSLVLCKFAIFCFSRDLTISSRLSQDFVSVWICACSIFLTKVKVSVETQEGTFLLTSTKLPLEWWVYAMQRLSTGRILFFPTALTFLEIYQNSRSLLPKRKKPEFWQIIYNFIWINLLRRKNEWIILKKTVTRPLNMVVLNLNSFEHGSWLVSSKLNFGLFKL